MCEAHLEPTSSLFSFGGISLVVWGGGVPKLLPPTDRTHVRVKQHDALWANRALRSEKGPHKTLIKNGERPVVFFEVNQPGRGP